MYLSVIIWLILDLPKMMSGLARWNLWRARTDHEKIREVARIHREIRVHPDGLKGWS
jgi:hypothetical protein